MKIGIDIGSTTIKIAVLDENNRLIHSDYQRHLSQAGPKLMELLSDFRAAYPQVISAPLAVSGSAGMGLSQLCGVPFVQEVHATRLCVNKLLPDTDTVIELGGEDAKILFLKGIPDARMNGSCAGGTGAFIDQMATLLRVTTEELNELAKEKEKIYTIASRCGVFAKSDIQPLINQGARHSDIAASIFMAVVNQTIGGLAQGRPIEGNVLYLGGPLSFLSELRVAFDKGLGVSGHCPEHSLFYVAMGAALSTGKEINLDELMETLLSHKDEQSFAHMDPLFENEEAYRAFRSRHDSMKVPRASLEEAAREGVFLGVDAGSTTIKFALIDRAGRLLFDRYQSNSGNPVPLVRQVLTELYAAYPGIRFLRCAATGYGEDLIRSAFSLDDGIVETMAHLTAAKTMQPNVDFIIDIGGQDMKCVKVHKGVIDNIYLNEACSSGCGSFLQTFANALRYDIADFAALGLFAEKPVDLGSRCTVFMNSSVKQAQKDGATPDNISAGLSISVVKNALYKVIRPSSKEALGRNIVVQGGTFYNDAVLRAFEQELEVEVVRPDIAGLMGAYGAALYARDQYREGESTLVSSAGLAAFRHKVQVLSCGLCPNRCRLTVNTFAEGRRLISGNRCERPVTKGELSDEWNLYAKKVTRLSQYAPSCDQVDIPALKKDGRGLIGLPMGLNIYELLPFWQAFFASLGYKVVTSPPSDRKLYLRGQGTIPSDTVCFPAKLIHGHVQRLIDAGVDTIFYPCMSYNMDDGQGDNCYNCPIVAYYPEVIDANMPDAKKVRFLHGYVGIHRKKDVAVKLWEMLRDYDSTLTKAEVQKAVTAAYNAYDAYMEDVRQEGADMIARARAAGKPILVLAGRPYHIDSEINHGMDKLITGLGLALVSEDALCHYMADDTPLSVLNQWTYHRRLYHTARYVATQPDMELVQLVSFGCGCDAITTDECRSLLEGAGRIYTQIKIDEIENLGAAKIRLRSLLAATGKGE